MKLRIIRLADIGRGALLILCGTISAWTVDLIHHSRYKVFAEGYRNILAGRPYSPAFSNRRLGPWSFRLLEKLFGSCEMAHSILVYATGLTLPWLGYILCRKLGCTVRRSMYTAFAISAGFVLLQDEVWLQAWDLFDTILFVIFAYAILRRLKVLQVIPLFLVMLLNRETALFVPAWLILRAFREKDRRELLAAAILFITGAAAVIAWRLPYLKGNLGFAWVGGNHFRPFVNTSILLGGDLDAWLVLFLAAAVTAAAARVLLAAMKNGNAEAWTRWDAMAVAGLMSLMILTVGHIGELRLFLPVAPLVIMSTACRGCPPRERVYRASLRKPGKAGI